MWFSIGFLGPEGFDGGTNSSRLLITLLLSLPSPFECLYYIPYYEGLHFFLSLLLSLTLDHEFPQSDNLAIFFMPGFCSATGTSNSLFGEGMQKIVQNSK